MQNVANHRRRVVDARIARTRVSPPSLAVPERMSAERVSTEGTSSERVHSESRSAESTRHSSVEEHVENVRRIYVVFEAEPSAGAAASRIPGPKPACCGLRFRIDQTPHAYSDRSNTQTLDSPS